jgi:hypothetical protein
MPGGMSSRIVMSTESSSVDVRTGDPSPEDY